MCTKFLLENVKGRGHLGDVGVDVRRELKWILKETGHKSVGWFHLAQDRDQWRALMNMVMHLQVL
jgi:hypothetical protein